MKRSTLLLLAISLVLPAMASAQMGRSGAVHSGGVAPARGPATPAFRGGSVTHPVAPRAPISVNSGSFSRGNFTSGSSRLTPRMSPSFPRGGSFTYAHPAGTNSSDHNHGSSSSSSGHNHGSTSHHHHHHSIVTFVSPNWFPTYWYDPYLFYPGYYPGYSYPPPFGSDDSGYNQPDSSDDNSQNAVYAPPPESNYSAPPQQQAYAAPAPKPAAPAQSAAPEESQATVLVFRDGHQREVSNYAIMGSTLYVLAGKNARIPVVDLDVPATVRANQDRGVEFKVPPNKTPTKKK